MKYLQLLGRGERLEACQLLLMGATMTAGGLKMFDGATIDGPGLTVTADRLKGAKNFL